MKWSSNSHSPDAGSERLENCQFGSPSPGQHHAGLHFWLGSDGETGYIPDMLTWTGQNRTERV